MGATLGDVTQWLTEALDVEVAPASLAEVKVDDIVAGIRMRFTRAYAVQVMLPEDLQSKGFLIASHLSAFADGHTFNENRVYVDLELEPVEKAIKESYMAMRQWLREILGGNEFKPTWGPRWVFVHPGRRRTVYGGIDKNGKPFVCQATAEEAGMDLADLEAELADVFR